MKRQKTLFDFIERQKPPTKQKKEEKPREEELVQKLIELFEQHLKCFTKEEVAMMLGVSKFKAVKLLNELSQIGVVIKRLNDEGELVYCKKS